MAVARWSHHSNKFHCYFKILLLLKYDSIYFLIKNSEGNQSSQNTFLSQYINVLIFIATIHKLLQRFVVFFTAYKIIFCGLGLS